MTVTLQPIRLCEEAAYTDHPNIDRANGVIRNVKVLGKHSANGREYSDRALNDAARLYEGAEVFFDHDRKEPHRERRVLESIGTLRSSHRKGDAVYANLHYLTTHRDTPTMLERINRKMRLGLSHNADGDGQRRGGKLIVESIKRVNSVDLVLNPATNSGLFESRERSHYPVTREAFLDALNGRGSFLEDEPELGRDVKQQSREVDAAKRATAGELPPAESIEEFLKMHQQEVDAACQAAIGLVSRHPDLSAATIKSVVGKLVDEKRRHLAAVESILQKAETYTPPPAPGDEEPPATLESEWRKLHPELAPLYESDRPLGSYEEERRDSPLRSVGPRSFAEQLR